MKKVSALKKKNSLWTMLFFGFCVFIFIVISLVVKTVSMVRVSQFDGQNRFTVAVGRQGQVFGIVSFDPTSNATSVLKIKGATKVSYSEVGETLGLLPDGVVDMQLDTSFDLENSAGMGSIVWHFNKAKTQLTLYDVARLFLLAKSVPMANRQVVSVSLPMDDLATDKVVYELFSDGLVSSENLSIQVINATGVPGVGNSLARILTNMGGNVVSVVSAQEVEDRSNISFFGKNRSYSLEKISRLLKYPVSELEREGIADIVITVGKNKLKF